VFDLAWCAVIFGALGAAGVVVVSASLLRSFEDSVRRMR
jgi:hypothetical protein